MIDDAFLHPLGSGAFVLLAFLLFSSTIIAVWHVRKVRTPSDFLIADHKAGWFDFAASHIGYLTSLSASVVLYPALVYTYGPVAIPILVISYIIAFGVMYIVLSRSDDVKDYLKNDYGLPGFIASNYPEGRARTVLFRSSAVVIAIIYWAVFALEIVAVRNIFDAAFPGRSAVSVVVVAIVLVVVYASLGGYLGTMRTDGLQTGVLVVALSYISFLVLPGTLDPGGKLPGLLSSAIFKARSGVAVADVWVFGISYTVICAGFLLTSQDVWSRSSAVTGKQTVGPALVGLCVSLLGIIPIVALGLWGWHVLELNPGLTSPSEIQNIPAEIISRLAGKGPVGLLLPILIAVTISTADTALLTTTQAIGFVNSRWVDSVNKCRVLTVCLGLVGLIVALWSPNIVSALWGLGSISIAFVPLVLARIARRGRKTWPALFVLIGGTIIGLAAAVLGGQLADYAPLIVLLLAGILYPALQVLPIGRKRHGL